jgi:hypothetical protein
MYYVIYKCAASFFNHYVVILRPLKYIEIKIKIAVVIMDL